MSYIVPIHRPSGVRHAIKLNFVKSDEETVVVAKANRIEIYSYSLNEGLTLLHSKSIYGYIILLSSIRPASSATDHLFVGTDRYQYFTCSWDAETKQLKTEQSYVDQADKSLRDTRESDRVHIDPTRRFMTLELFDGIISVLPIIQPSNKRIKRESSSGTVGAGSLGEPVQVRIEEILTRATAFSDLGEDNKANPRLAMIWEDNQDIPQLKLRELKYQAGGDQAHVDLETVAELRAELDSGVSHLIPVSTPYGGFLILGGRTISYVDAELTSLHSESLEDAATVWSCWTKVDELRWLLADDYGRLFFLMLIVEDGRSVKSWRLDPLGEASKASCLVYLDEGFVFLGSHSGDSQVIRIAEGGVQVLQTLSNVAPILDLELMDLDRGAESAGQASEFSSGQARIVTASGAWQDGTIRSVRSGVGMEEIGTIGQIPLITDLWALNSTGFGQRQDTLLVTFVNGTRIFKFDADANVEEVDEFNNIEFSELTLHAANFSGNKLLQVHESGVRITDLESHMGIFQWKPPDATAKLTSACANGAHVLVVESGHTIHVFHSSGQDISLTASKKLPATSQISSITIPCSQSDVCIVSFWQTASVAILDLHSLESIYTQTLGEPGMAVPRSVLVANVLSSAPPTLFIAMADGTVITFSFDVIKNTFSNMTRILLGTEPVLFKALPGVFENGQQMTNVFASCEQPSLIYSSEGRIIYSAVNADRAARVCTFDSEAYPGAVALATPSELKLATIGTNRSTQLQTLTIGETVRCLAYDHKAKIFGLGCIRRIMESGVEGLMSSVKIADEVGFQELDSFELNDRELIECIIATGPILENEDEDGETGAGMFVVGTSISPEANSLNVDERGRIIVFQVDQKRKKLKIVTQAGVNVACRSLAMCDSFIVAGLVKVVCLYSLAPASQRTNKNAHELVRLATYRTSTSPIALSVQPSTPSSPAAIAVADLMKSISILSVLPPTVSQSGNWQLLESARHYATVWSTAAAAVAENEWILADADGNLAMLRRNTEAVTTDERKRLDLTGEMRLGEVVNRIVPIAPSGYMTKQRHQSTTAYSDPVTDINTGKGKERTRTLSATASKPTTAALTKQPSSLSQPSGPLITPLAFLATVEGSIYMLGGISPAYTDALLRLQSSLASRVAAPGYMPWTRFRAWKSDVRESEEPFRFVDGEMVEQGLLSLDNSALDECIKESGLGASPEEGGIGLTVEIVRSWGEEMRRLY